MVISGERMRADGIFFFYTFDATRSTIVPKTIPDTLEMTRVDGGSVDVQYALLHTNVVEKINEKREEIKDVCTLIIKLLFGS